MSASSSIAIPPVPRIKAGQGNLSYKTIGSDTWTLLPGTVFSDKYNIYNIDIKLKSVSLRQKLAKGTGACKIFLDPNHYGTNVKIGVDSDGTQSPGFLLELDLFAHPECVFSKVNTGWPLAYFLPTMRAIQLRIPQRQFRPFESQMTTRAQLAMLIMGQVSGTVGSENWTTLGN